MLIDIFVEHSDNSTDEKLPDAYSISCSSYMMGKIRFNSIPEKMKINAFTTKFTYFIMFTQHYAIHKQEKWIALILTIEPVYFKDFRNIIVCTYF